MPKLEEGETMIHAKVSDVTKERLQELAGGPRKIGVYLDEVVAMLYEAQEELDTAMAAAKRDVIAATIAKRVAKEDALDAALAKAGREAYERGERETVTLEEVEAELRAKGLLSV
jgi:hypothetical protein